MISFAQRVSEIQMVGCKIAENSQFNSQFWFWSLLCITHFKVPLHTRQMQCFFNPTIRGNKNKNHVYGTFCDPNDPKKLNFHEDLWQCLPYSFRVSKFFLGYFGPPIKYKWKNWPKRAFKWVFIRGRPLMVGLNNYYLVIVFGMLLKLSKISVCFLISHDHLWGWMVRQDSW